MSNVSAMVNRVVGSTASSCGAVRRPDLVSSTRQSSAGLAVETDRSGALWAATLGNEDPPAPGTLVKIIKVRAKP